MQMPKKVVAMLLVASMLVSMASPAIAAENADAATDPAASQSNGTENTDPSDPAATEGKTEDTKEENKENSEASGKDETQTGENPTPDKTETPDGTTDGTTDRTETPDSTTDGTTDKTETPDSGDTTEPGKDTANKDTTPEQNKTETVPAQNTPAVTTDTATHPIDNSYFAQAELEDPVKEAIKKACNITYTEPLKPEDFTLENAAKITSLEVHDINLTYIKGIQCLTNLETLNLSGCSIANANPNSYLDSLKKLTSINLSGNQIENPAVLNPIADQLTSLDLSNQHGKFTDVASLVSFTNLTSLNLSNNSRLADLSKFSPMTFSPGLALDLSNCAITNLNGLDNLSGLISVNVSENDIRAIGVFPDTLTELNLSGLTNLEDLTTLSAKGLEKLNLSGCTNLKEIGNIPKLSALKELDLSHTRVKSVTQFTGPASLKKLSLSGNGIAGIAPASGNGLEKLTALTDLDLSDNSIKDLGTADKSYLPTSLTSLKLQDNIIESPVGLTTLTALKTLNINNNSIPDKDALGKAVTKDVNTGNWLDSTMKTQKGYNESVEKQKLLNKLDDAAVQTKRKTDGELVISKKENGTDVLTHLYWVKQTDWDTFQQAVTTAQAVRDNASATTDELTKATTDLDTAIKALINAKKGTLLPDVNKATLNATINKATADVKKVKPSKDGKDIPSDQKWATPEDIKALNDAITAAQTVYKNANASQNDVDGANTALQTAITTFSGKVEDGTSTDIVKQTTITRMTNTLKTAQNLLNVTEMSTTGEELSADQMWVDKDVYATFNKAVETAQTALAAATKEGTTTKDSALTSAINTLEAARTTFETVRKPGKKTAQFTVEFNTNGSNDVIETQKVASGQTVTKPANDPTKEGYQFAGWYKDDKFQTEWNFDTDTVTVNTVIYAKWAKMHTVTFDSNEGSAVAPVTVADGKNLSAPTAPTKDNCLFVGWYKDINFATPWDFANDVVTGDITLYAKWDYTVQGYNLTLSGTGNEYGSVAVTVNGNAASSIAQFKEGDKITLTATPNANGKFVAWASSDINIEKPTSSTLTFTMPANAVNISYTFVTTATTTYNVSVSVSGTGGRASANATTAEAGETISLTATANSGYTFDYWESTPSVTFANSSSANTTFTMPSSAVTVRAHFKSVSDNNNGGNIINGGGSSSGGSSSSSSKDKSKSSSSSSSSSASSSSKSSTSAKATSATKSAVAKAVKAAKASGEDSTKANVRLKDVTTISPSVFKSINTTANSASGSVDVDVTVHADTTSGGKVLARLYIDPVKAAKLTKSIKTKVDVSVSDKDNSNAVKAAKKSSAKNAVAVTFDQKGSFGISIKAAVKVDLSKLNKKSLVFYTYDAAKGTFTKIKAPAYFIDTNGYLHFTTTVGGTVVISDKPLTK